MSYAYTQPSSQGSKAGRDELRLLLTQTLGALPLALRTQETVMSTFLAAGTEDHAPLQMQLIQLLLQHAPDKVRCYHAVRAVQLRDNSTAIRICIRWPPASWVSTLIW